MPAAPHRTARFLTISLLALYMALPATLLQAQYEYKWMDIGRLSTPYSSGGALRDEEADIDNQLAFPAIEKNSGNKRSEGLWIAAKNFTDEEGVTWPVKIAHLGPRPSSGDAQFFGREFKLVSRFEPPVVRVDGNISFRYWSVVDEVDPALKADRMIYNRNVNRVGIELEQKIYAFDQQYHDNYHIIEYTFKNTGDVDEDSDVELPDQVLEGVYFFWIQRYGFHAASAWITGVGALWGQFTMNDAVGDGHEDYGVDFTAQYAWAGYNVDQTDFNSLGQPMWREHVEGWLADLATPGDTLGRLAAGHFTGRVYIHADNTADDPTNAVITTPAGTWPDGADPADLAGRQPSTMGFFNSDNADLVENEYDESLMLRQYNEHITAGRYYPHHADLVEPSDPGQPPGQYFATPRDDPSTILGIHDMGGWSFVEGFGPYTLNPGDDVHLVVAEGVAGLSDSAKLEIGIAYKASGADDAALIEWPAGSGVELTKNQWVLSSRDSLFDMFERAIANYESGFDIPRAPLPPEAFTVTSGPDQITLEWGTYPEATQTGFEIWRTQDHYHDSNGYVLIASLPPSDRSYIDVTVVRGVPYFYYISAIGDINTDPTGLTPTGVVLKSNRYYTQTYHPAWVNTPPVAIGDQANLVPHQFALHQNYPNPFNPNTIVHYSLPVATEVKLVVHDILGREVARLVDDYREAGYHRVVWNGRDAGGRDLPAGLYIARMMTPQYTKSIKMLLLK